MFGIKTAIENHYKKKYFNNKKINRKPLNWLDNILLLYYCRQKLTKELPHITNQTPAAKLSNPWARFVFKLLAKFMPNNLGNWSIKPPNSFAGKIENNILEILKDYYHAPKEIAGHFSSGSTEGNIYATWIGRNYLTKKLKLDNLKKIILLKTSLTHYSIDKAADVCHVATQELIINEKEFNIDEKYLIKSLTKLYSKGYRGFIIPLTLGYTVTGTEDNIASLQDIISNFESSHQDCRVFVWVDASLAGISKIYLENSFRPFAYSKVQLITTDFHKFLAVPYPASMLLYRRNLIEYIERQIPYFDQIDSTLLGSRPGLNVLAAWLTLLNLNPEKGKNIFTKKLKEKKDFLKKIMVVDSKIKIVTHPTSLQAGVILNGISNKSILALKNKYKLHPFKYTLNLQGGKKVVKICKLYFFPDFELKKHE